MSTLVTPKHLGRSKLQRKWWQANIDSLNSPIADWILIPSHSWSATERQGCQIHKCLSIHEPQIFIYPELGTNLYWLHVIMKREEEKVDITHTAIFIHFWLLQGCAVSPWAPWVGLGQKREGPWMHPEEGNKAHERCGRNVRSSWGLWACPVWRNGGWGTISLLSKTSWGQQVQREELSSSPGHPGTGHIWF